MRVILLTLILTLAVIAPHPVRAQSRATFVPSISFGTVYDDNLFALPVHNADFMNQLTPSLEASWESPSLTLQSLYSFDMQRSIKNPALNTFEARRHAFFDSTWKPSTRVAFGLGSRYDRSETPGDLSFDTGFLHERRRAFRWQVTPSVSFKATPFTTVTSNYSYTEEALAGDVHGSVQVGRLTVARQVSERATINVAAVQRYFEDRSGTHATVTPMLGLSYEVAPFTTLSLQGGPRFTGYAGVQPELSASIARATNRIKASADYWRGETIILGIAGPVAIESIAGKLAWPVKRNLELGTHLAYFDSHTIEEARARIYHAALVAAWSPGGPYTIAGSYGADFQQGDVRGGLFAGKRVLRNVFLLRVTVAPRLSRSFLPPDEEARAKGVVR